MDIGTKLGTNGKSDIEGLRVNRNILDMRIKQVNNSIDMDTAIEIAEVNEGAGDILPEKQQLDVVKAWIDNQVLYFVNIVL